MILIAICVGGMAGFHFLKGFYFDRMVAHVETDLVQEPDSALLMLKNLSSGDLTEEEEALYALLYTEANFEKKHAIDDSVLKVAYTYYVEEKRGNVPREVTAELYYGLGLLEQGKQAEALVVLLNVYDRREVLPISRQKELLRQGLDKIYRCNALHQEEERSLGDDTIGISIGKDNFQRIIDVRQAQEVAVAEMKFESEKKLRKIWQSVACMVAFLLGCLLLLMLYAYRKKIRERRLVARISKYIHRIHVLDGQLTDNRKNMLEKIKLEQKLNHNMRLLAGLRGNLKEKEIQLEGAQRKFAAAMLVKCYLSKLHAQYGERTFDYRFLLEGYKELSTEQSSYYNRLKEEVPGLTAREYFICILYHEGFSDEDIMEAIGTSKSTFKVVKSRLFSKYNKKILE